jgi:carbonic anhydrase/acetyltransferase-like protein (isoleucine patch superfamily)
MPVFAFERFIPVLPPKGRFWIAPDANVIGQVELGEDVGICSARCCAATTSRS